VEWEKQMIGFKAARWLVINKLLAFWCFVLLRLYVGV
jgi:hypothetical protein